MPLAFRTVILGSGHGFDLARGKFAIAYVDQTEQDYDQLAHTARDGRITAVYEEEQSLGSDLRGQASDVR